MENETAIRIGFFFGIFAIMSLWEVLSPRRVLTTSKKFRWFNNLTIVFLNPILLRLVMPIFPVQMSVIARNKGWGLFNNLALPYWLAVVAGVLILDCVIYFQHVIFHMIPPFWRIHRMHHTDLDFDVTTGLRFHPIEIFLSMGIKLGAVALIGAPALAVIIFEVLLNGTSMFNHSNVYIPLRLDRLIRLLVVTPDMHRVHHSIVMRESNRNFGFNLSLWDRLFRTYKAQPDAGHKDMTIGLAEFRNARKLSLPWLMAIPFIDKSRFGLSL